MNRIIAEHLDSRSFITMTYAVIDCAPRPMTYARAGHTPLIFLPARSPAAPVAQVLTPSGMVLGLRIDGAAEKFERAARGGDDLDSSSGDVIVFLHRRHHRGDERSQTICSASPRSAASSRSMDISSPEELRERILREVEAFVGDAPTSTTT